jgi:hypothetical protein
MKWIVGIGTVVVLALIGVLMYASYNNTEVQLRNAVSAQQKSNEAVFDNCWKTIQQIAQVTDRYKDGFRQVFVDLTEARHYDKGGTLFKWITESNPSFDQGLYQKLANAIESHRLSFTREQQKLIDLKREHDNVRMTIPGRWFVGGRPAVEIQVVTSTRTEKTFVTGKDDDTDVFKK